MADDIKKNQQRLNRMAWILDSSIPLPGGFRIGLDGLIGLIPGIGDTVGAVLSSYILAQAARMGAPRSMLIQMAWNIALESLVGLIPIVGDIFDFGYKANNRNVKLLNDYLAQPQTTVHTSRKKATVIVIGVVLFLILMLWLAFAVLRAVLEVLAG